MKKNNGFTKPSRGTNEVVAEPRHHMGSLLNLLSHPEFISGSSNSNGGQILKPSARTQFVAKSIDFDKQMQVQNDKTLSEGVPEALQGTSIRNSGEGSNSLLLGRNAQPTALAEVLKEFPHPLRGRARVGGIKAAFTLAEVLITLAIIGVVAAMTIPTLVVNQQEKGWETSSSVFQRKLGEALQVMNIQQNLMGLGTTENFVAELGKHLKLTKVCDNNNLQGCFTDSVTWNDTEVDMSKVKTAKNFSKDWNTNVIGFQTASGVNALVAYNPNCKSNPYASSSKSGDGSGSAITLSGTNNQRRGSVTLGTGGCLAVLFDVQGFSKPNTQNKDIREVGGINLATSSCKDVNGVCVSQVLQPGDWEPVNCTDSTADGYQYCGNGHNYSSDYWAGAMKACNGKLASGDDLAKIANYIYNTNVFAKETNNYSLGSGAYDSTKAQEIGFPSSTVNLSVWSSEEGSIDSKARYRSFFDSGSGGSDYSRSNPGYWAVCVE